MKLHPINLEFFILHLTKSELLKFIFEKSQLENIQSVSVGSYTSFAIDKNGILYGWGLNNADEMLLFY